MKAWLISITAVCLLLIVLELFISEGKTKKYIQGILRLSIIIVLLSPLVKLKDINISNLSIETLSTQNEEYKNNGLDNLIKNNVEEKIASELSDYGIDAVVNVYLTNASIEKIVVVVNKTGINENQANIYTNEKIIECVKKIVSVDKDDVYVYEN